MKSCEEILYEKGTNMISVNDDARLDEAIRKMVENKIGAILIKKNREVIGIWTERDLMRDIIKEGFDTKKEMIIDHMTKNLISAPASDTVYNLMDKFLGKRLRHLLIKKDDRYIGLLSIGDVIKATLREKTEELNELKAMVSWDYYEDWGWKKR